MVIFLAVSKTMAFNLASFIAHLNHQAPGHSTKHDGTVGLLRALVLRGGPLRGPSRSRGVLHELETEDTRNDKVITQQSYRAITSLTTIPRGGAPPPAPDKRQSLPGTGQLTSADSRLWPLQGWCGDRDLQHSRGAFRVLAMVGNHKCQSGQCDCRRLTPLDLFWQYCSLSQRELQDFGFLFTTLRPSNHPLGQSVLEKSIPHIVPWGKESCKMLQIGAR